MDVGPSSWRTRFARCRKSNLTLTEVIVHYATNIQRGRHVHLGRTVVHTIFRTNGALVHVDLLGQNNNVNGHICRPVGVTAVRLKAAETIDSCDNRRSASAFNRDFARRGINGYDFPAIRRRAFQLVGNVAQRHKPAIITKANLDAWSIRVIPICLRQRDVVDLSID